MRYHFLLRVTHWLMALCIIGLIIYGFVMVHILPGDDWPIYYPIHRSFGMLILFLLPIRYILRKKTTIPPLPESMKPSEKKASHIVHIALYAMMIIVPISGYISSSSGGHDVQFFFTVLPNYIGRIEWLFALAGPAHMIIAYIMTALVALHIAGAIKHRYFEDKGNDVMPRMGFSRQKQHESGTHDQ